MAEEYTDEIYQPDERADVDQRITPGSQVRCQARPTSFGLMQSDPRIQRPRKYKDGKRLRKKNDQGLFVYDVTIVSAEYDSRIHRWLYTLDDFEGKRIDGTTREIDLG
ncbi:MAG: hypothetical protein Q9195_004511 [Heterodermia aff. obscurata]